MQGDIGRYSEQLQVLLAAPRVDARPNPNQVLQRVNVLAHKLERASAYLSLHSFDLARYYLHSTRHDLAAISTLLQAGAKGLGSRLVCGS